MSPTSYQTAPFRDIQDNLMAEKEGFEPPRRFRPPGFQDQSLQPDLGISPNMVPKAGLEPARGLTPAGF